MISDYLSNKAVAITAFAFLIGLIMGVVVEKTVGQDSSDVSVLVSPEKYNEKVDEGDRMREVDGIRIEDWPASKLRKYHLREDFGRSSQWHRGFNDTPENKTMAALSRIDGVVEIRKANYTVGVIISETYSWEEIEPKVLTILNKPKLKLLKKG
jgi:hypothetical protein